MTLSLDYCCINDISYEERRMYSAAKVRLACYKFGTDDKILDLYFKKNFNSTLRKECEKLVENFSLNEDKAEQKVIVYFKNKEDDKIASLITYGNLEVKGSKILKKIFKLIL